MTAFYVNGLDTSTLGFVVDDVVGAFDVTDRSDQTLAMPQGTGLLLGATPGRVSERVITVGGTIMGLTRAEIESRQDQLKAILADGVVELRFAHRAIVFRGRLASLSVTPIAPQLRETNPAARVGIRVLCADPYGYDVDPQLVGFGATAVAMPLGTAPSRGRSWWSAVITIAGAATTPTLTESDASGTALRQMVFTWNPTVNDALEIDCGRGLVTRIQSGVRDNGLPYVTAGFAFPRLDPADGDYASGAFPRLAVSSGTGVARYYRSWR